MVVISVEFYLGEEGLSRFLSKQAMAFSKLKSSPYKRSVGGYRGRRGRREILFESAAKNAIPAISYSC